MSVPLAALGLKADAHTWITRKAAVLRKCLAGRAGQGDSRGFDSHHPLVF